MAVTNCGRAIIREKLRDLEERFGITHEELNAAYSSQTCSNPACEYVDHRNRQGEAFRCRLCGHTQHADVNAARTLRARRSRPEVSDVTRPHAAILRTLVARVNARQPRRSARWIGPLGRPGDPRETCRYYADTEREVTSMSPAPSTLGSDESKG